MSETPPQPETGFWPEWIKPKRIAEFTKNVLKLENSVKNLEKETLRLRDQIDRLQTQVEVLSARNEDQMRFIQAIASRDPIIIETKTIDQISNKTEENKNK